MALVASIPWTTEAFRDHERHLWGLAYRMTGSAADADDVVQETFARAVEQPPACLDAPVRPWLTRVAINLARDALRRRRRRPYVGPWLPSPIDTSDLAAPPPRPDDEREYAAEPPDPSDTGSAEARYDLAESASYAFLVALEALTAQQRAVLLLREVLDYSVRETAEALGLREGNVKTTHHRARHAMRAYDRARRPPTAALGDATREALQRFLLALVSGDAAAVEGCLSEGARTVTDGGGQYIAALRPIVGKDRIARFLLGLQRKAMWRGQIGIRSLNGLPAVVAEMEAAPARWAPRFVLRCEIDAAGAMREIHIVIASAKLGAVVVAGAGAGAGAGASGSARDGASGGAGAGVDAANAVLRRSE
jgi:RNA polymerase sigma-70 factor (ECF subfamily)